MVVVVVVVVSRGLTAAAARGSKGQGGPLPPGKRNCTVYKDVAGAGAYGVFCGGGAVFGVTPVALRPNDAGGFVQAGEPPDGRVQTM